MSYAYEYQRNLSNGKYDLENDVDYIDDQPHVHPAEEIVAAFPGNKFKIFGLDKTEEIVFEKELSPAEKTTLDTIVSNARKF